MDYTPQEAPCAVETRRRRFSIGLPASSDPTERRFPLTPEGVSLLRAKGFGVKIESGAAAPIHYTDAAYARCGAEIVTGPEAWQCDIIIHLAPLTEPQVCGMRRGALLLTLLNIDRQQPRVIRMLLERRIISVAVDLVRDNRGNHPFADILSEIDGRASIALASALLADSRHGKGILLGGIAGVGACEVTVFGSGIAACAAARSAAGAGALVRMFDNDIYSLRYAQRELGTSAVTSALHPRVVEGALRSADIVISTLGAHDMPPLEAETVRTLKRGAILFDLGPRADGAIFPGVPTADAGDWSERRIRTVSDAHDNPTRLCIVRCGNLVPRTAAMALTNTFATMLGDLVTCDGVNNALKLLPGLQRAAFTFLGKPVNPDIARVAGLRPVDISFILTLS